MRTLVLLCLSVHVARSQIFQDELAVSLQPPPLNQVIPKNDFSVFISDLQPVLTAEPILPPKPQQPSQALPPPPPKHIANPTVLFTAEQDSKLPPYLLNPFYKNPRIADQLAKQSWFVAGENLVTDRETEKIPRDKIIYMLKSAGLARRRRFVNHAWYP